MATPLRALTLSEAKLLIREPIQLFWGIAFPIVLMVVMGAFSTGPEADLGGLPLAGTYLPILLSFVTTAFALQGMPAALAGYRERGVLRRLATTPAGPVRVLAAQLLVNLCTALVAAAGVIAVAILGFGVPLPRQPLAFLAALLLCGAAMFALGLLVAALAPSGRSASAIGAIVFFPMMFFAGLWVPRAMMPATLAAVSDFTPLGAAVRAMHDGMFAATAPLVSIAVLAAYAVAFAVPAARFFRWS